MAKRALVTGILGQDGAYLSRLLLEKGYEVFGCVRQNASSVSWRLDELGLTDQIRTVDFDLLEGSNVQRALAGVEPDEIYNLGAMSFVGVSFNQPLLTGETNALGVTRILEAMRVVCPQARFYQASTSEMFGKVQAIPQNETTPFYPRSPYGVAKLYGHWITVNYRESFDLFACSGILFNHESPMRGEQFVTRKITRHLCEVSLGRRSEVRLGNMDAKRDWGHAADYVTGMWQMLQAETANDYVLATGETRTVREFVEAAARRLEMDIAWEGEGVEERGVDRKTGRTVVAVDPAFFRPAEVDLLVGDPGRAERELGWTRQYGFQDLVSEMVEHDLRRLTGSRAG